MSLVWVRCVRCRTASGDFVCGERCRTQHRRLTLSHVLLLRFSATVLLVAGLGNMLEWFDFAVFGYAGCCSCVCAANWPLRLSCVMSQRVCS